MLTLTRVLRGLFDRTPANTDANRAGTHFCFGFGSDHDVEPRPDFTKQRFLRKFHVDRDRCGALASKGKHFNRRVWPPARIRSVNPECAPPLTARPRKDLCAIRVRGK